MASDDLILTLMRDGFARLEKRLDGIDQHLSTLNGSVARHETQIALLRQREDFSGRDLAACVEARVERPARSSDAIVTRGGVKKTAALIGLGVALIEAVRAVGQWAKFWKGW